MKRQVIRRIVSVLTLVLTSAPAFASRHVDAPDKAGYTPLSNAVDYEHLALAGFLLDHGADPNIRIRDSYILTRAVFKNDKEMLELLIKHGANINAVGRDHGTLNKAQKTALGWARAQKLSDMVSILTAAGAKE